MVMPSRQAKKVPRKGLLPSGVTDETGYAAFLSANSLIASHKKT